MSNHDLNIKFVNVFCALLDDSLKELVLHVFVISIDKLTFQLGKCWNIV